MYDITPKDISDILLEIEIKLNVQKNLPILLERYNKENISNIIYIKNNTKIYI